MSETRILLTTPAFPYPTLPANDSLTDATGQRFTHGDGLFSIISHTHCFANHILAQNVDVPCLLLEYPRWEDFTVEVAKGYPIIGISAYPVHLDMVMKMCLHIRERSPGTKILLGSYGGQAFEAQYDEETQKRYVDHVIHGEGVSFLRGLLGEEADRPIRQALMPKAGGTLPFLSKYPQGTVGFLVSGLGCIGGCDFCSSTALFDRKRIQLLSPAELVEHINLYHQNFPQVRHVFVVEEDHFRFPKYLHETSTYWMEHPRVMERIDWFAFGSIDYIGRYAQEYGWDALAETGIGCIFIGVESKFAGEHGYEKRQDIDAREVFTRLHNMGIRTIGAWMCGWDFHDHNNMMEDLNYFVSLYPTYQQLTRVSPFPGTELWDRLKDEGRVMEVPWEDVHFWSGAQKNVTLEAHETLNLVEDGYELMTRTWGPSILRRLDVELNGYAFCCKSESPVLRQHKALFFKRQCALFWTFLRAMDRFAPNGVVRRRVRKMDEKYQALMGKPTPVMEALARGNEALATIYKVKSVMDPPNRHPKEEPYKRYVYHNNGLASGAIPYITERQRPSLKVRAEMEQEKLSFLALETSMKALGALRRSKGDPDLDNFLCDLIHCRSFGFGF